MPCKQRDSAIGPSQTYFDATNCHLLLSDVSKACSRALWYRKASNWLAFLYTESSRYMLFIAKANWELRGMVEPSDNVTSDVLMRMMPTKRLSVADMRQQRRMVQLTETQRIHALRLLHERVKLRKCQLELDPEPRRQESLTFGSFSRSMLAAEYVLLSDVVETSSRSSSTHSGLVAASKRAFVATIAVE